MKIKLFDDLVDAANYDISTRTKLSLQTHMPIDGLSTWAFAVVLVGLVALFLLAMAEHYHCTMLERLSRDSGVPHF